MREHLKNELRRAMVGFGYEVVGTGGGCEAYYKQLEGKYEFITVADDPSIPVDLYDMTHAGVYVGNYATEDTNDAENVGNFYCSFGELLTALSYYADEEGLNEGGPEDGSAFAVELLERYRDERTNV